MWDSGSKTAQTQNMAQTDYSDKDDPCGKRSGECKICRVERTKFAFSLERYILPRFYTCKRIQSFVYQDSLHPFSRLSDVVTKPLKPPRSRTAAIFDLGTALS